MALSRPVVKDTEESTVDQAAIDAKAAEQAKADDEAKLKAAQEQKDKDVQAGKDAEAQRQAEAEFEAAAGTDEPQDSGELVNDPEPVLDAETRAQEADKTSGVELRAEPATAVATVSANTAVAAVAEQRSSMTANFKQEMAEQGFEDIELTGRSFDRVILHEGKFKLGEFELGLEFKFIAQSSRAVYVVRQDDSQDAKVYYSYDPKGEYQADGTSAEDILAEWREDGYATEDNPVDIKKYMELMVTLTDREDEYEDQMVLLSIPPASRDRVAGIFAQVKQKLNCAPNGAVLLAKVGKEVGEGKKKFRPWVFAVSHKIG